VQEQNVLEATIAKIKESNYVNEPQSLVQQELSEAELQLLKTKDDTEKVKKPKKFLHIMPHSHADEGWLATTNDTFSGDDDNATFTGGVRDILDSVVEQLILEGKANRTFAFAQTKMFKEWYDIQSNITKEKVRGLVKEGRLDLVNGGWTTPDEATTQFDSLIDNFMVGQQWL